MSFLLAILKIGRVETKDGFDSRTRYQSECRETRVESREPSNPVNINHHRKEEAVRNRFRFEKLNVWQDARVLNRTVYRLTRGFPKHELFGMTSQIRRASVSVSSNIAEGAGRNSDKDFAHFLEQGYGSLMEVASLMFLAWDEAYVSEKDANALFDDIDKLAGGVAALNRSLEVKTSKTRFTR